MTNEIKTIAGNLAALGPKRLSALAAAFVMMIAVITVGAFVLNRPTYEPLYVGLERDDVSRMGAVLGEAGIPFDVNAQSDTLMVPAGSSSRARMILAEKGLPTSSGAGYELFDDLGSLGLTSFMQEVTRVRALEGEIARSIQTIVGIKAARVHIVMADEGSFRRATQVPTASVVIRFDREDVASAAGSIRHLVASAVPALTTENVTVLDTNGRLLASGEDEQNNTARSSIALQKTVENEVEDKIHKALAAVMGANNFRVSVQAQINTDQRQIEEVTFDPDSRVERSVQVVRSEEASSESLSSDAVTVEQGLPEENPGEGDGSSASERSERREETTNYELSSKRIATVSNGYTVSRLSIAIVLNRGQFVDANGDPISAADISARLDEINAVVRAAAGYSEERGDVLTTTALDFVETVSLTGSVAPGTMSTLSEHVGTAINALAFLAAVVAAILFGVRPLTNVLRMPQQIELEDKTDVGIAQLDSPQAEAQTRPLDDTANADIDIRLDPEPADRLRKIVDLDERRAADILRRWVNNEVHADG